MTISSERDALAPTFAKLGTLGRRALIPYLTCGYPEPAATAGLLDALADAGADIIELGVPFSDPVADGPTIQRSSQIALDHGVTLDTTLETLRAFRTRHDTPVVLFTYLNPLMRHGVDRFIADARDAGAQGVLVTDLPVGGDEALERALEESPLALVRLIAPTTSRARALQIAARAQGFVYYIARMGVTGATTELRSGLATEVEALRERTDVPIAVGFGISTPDQAATVGRAADGVIVGSALIDAIGKDGIDGARTLIAAMRTAMDAQR